MDAPQPKGAAGDRPLRRGPARRHDAREAREAAPGLPRGRHRHGRQLVADQRRRRLPRARLRRGPEAARRPASRSRGSSRSAPPASTPPTWASAPCRRCARRSTAPGSTVDDLDLVELNEAFAAQVLASMRELGIPHEKLNVNGGAIALGHPLGCSGARLVDHAHLGDAPPRRPLRRRHDVHRRRPGPRDGGGSRLSPGGTVARA